MTEREATSEVAGNRPAREPAADRPASLLGSADLIRTAAWFGILAGAIESVAFAFRPHVVNSQAVTFDPHVFWMTPLACSLWFVAGALLFAPVARFVPRLAPPRVVVFAIALVSTMTVLFLFAPEVNRKASAVLAAGVAFQTSRAVGARLGAFLACVRRSLPWMAAGVAAVAAVVYGGAALRERGFLRGLPPAAPNSPNVLLIVLDTVRADDLSLYGYGRETSPNLTKFARSGVLFQRAVTPAPWTLPSHSTIFTGRDFHALGVGPNIPLDGRFPTLAEIMGAHGYATAGFAANRGNCGAWSGLGRGFAHYDDFCVSPTRFIESPALIRYLIRNAFKSVFAHFDRIDRIGAPSVRNAFLRWQSGRDDRPFFAFLNFIDAHGPYLPPHPYDTQFGLAPPPDPGFLWDWTWNFSPERPDKRREAEVPLFQAQYDGALACLDHEIGIFLDDLRERGLLEKTLVIVTSDHGEEFNEHGVCGHGASVYMLALHAPLVMSMPTVVPAGRVVPDVVGVRDIGATILDVAGLSGESARFPGTSLARRWSQSPPGEEPVLSELEAGGNWPKWWPTANGSLQSVVADGFHYIHADNGVEELYRWDQDPWETRNLVREPDQQASLERCRASLARLVRR